MFNDSSINDLKEIFRKYFNCNDESPVIISKGYWTLAEGGYNEWWELYYGSELRSVAVCKKGIVSVYGFSDDENKKAKEIILSILLYLK